MVKLTEERIEQYAFDKRVSLIKGEVRQMARKLIEAREKLNAPTKSIPPPPQGQFAIAVQKKRTRRADRPGEAFIRMRLREDMTALGYVSKTLRLQTDAVGKRITIEIDKESRQFRARISDAAGTGYKISSGFQFACPSGYVDECGLGRIKVELAKDGWWYGVY